MFDEFVIEATRLKNYYANKIKIIVGFESEWLHTTHNSRTENSSLKIIRQLQEEFQPHLDFFIGSVHHVHNIPIDFSRELYTEAREISNSTSCSQSTDGQNVDNCGQGADEALFKDYLDAQYDMIRALHPPVVGHFDLIRLFSDSPDGSWQSLPEVWWRVGRNLNFVASYGGMIEMNSSSIRKGLREIYPKVEICKVLKSIFPFIELESIAHTLLC